MQTLQGLESLKTFPLKTEGQFIFFLFLNHLPYLRQTCADPGGNVGKRIVHARKGKFGAGCWNISIIKMHRRDSGLTFLQSAKLIPQSFNYFFQVLELCLYCTSSNFFTPSNSFTELLSQKVKSLQKRRYESHLSYCMCFLYLYVCAHILVRFY